MNRILLVLAVPLAVFGPRPAQAQAIRLHGGVNQSTVLVDEQQPGVEIGRRMGVNLGVGYAVPLTDRASLRFEADYHQKGFAADFTLDGVSVGSDNELIYVEFAPQLVLGSRNLHVLAGPWIGYNLRCTLSAVIDGVTRSDDCEAAGDEVADFDLGAAAGLGIGVDLGSGWKAGVEAVASLGFLNTSPDSAVTRNLSFRGRAFVDVPIG